MHSASQTDLPRWLPRASLDVLVAVEAVLGNAEWLLVGALARDHAFRDSDDLGRLRATMDVDLAVLVATWDEFAAAFEGLIRSGGFQRTGVRHRLRHANGQLLDVLPFGGVEVGSHIAWPPDGEPEMNMMGFGDAFRASSRVALPGDLRIRVATPPGVALLKIIAWHDNPAERERDLEDIAAFIRGYVTEILGWNAAFKAYADVMTADGFDLDEAGAEALGRDIAGILSPAVHGRFVGMVDGLDAAESRFAAGVQEYLHLDFERARRVCAKLLLGIREGRRE
jgi:predicted nucleotidyltransferase